MNKNFSEGRLIYQVSQTRKVDENFLVTSAWANGFYAFSHGEFTLSDFDTAQLIGMDLYQQQVEAKGESVYLNEINLWRHKKGFFEEIVLERVPQHFMLQKWQLHTDKTLHDSLACFYRKADTTPSKGHLFSPLDLTSMEVIVPEKRLHFFLTTGEV